MDRSYKIEDVMGLFSMKYESARRYVKAFGGKDVALDAIKEEVYNSVVEHLKKKRQFSFSITNEAGEVIAEKSNMGMCAAVKAMRLAAKSNKGEGILIGTIKKNEETLYMTEIYRNDKRKQHSTKT